jgi:hypothetical protein
MEVSVKFTKTTLKLLKKVLKSIKIITLRWEGRRGFLSVTLYKKSRILIGVILGGLMWVYGSMILGEYTFGRSFVIGVF